ncbi:hypothetical protein BDZ97DRAFT_2015904 [Flammula alnicola]|nr:hypothetical protein BDZ97DRAFT_2015904 [Flammula alnicola]
MFAPPTSTQLHPPARRELDDDAEIALHASTTLCETNSGLPSSSIDTVEAQMDGKSVSNTGNSLPLSKAWDNITNSTMTSVRANAAITSSHLISSIEMQNAHQIRTHTSLLPLPKEEGIPSSTMATRVEVGQPISPSLFHSVELQNSRQKKSITRSSTQNKPEGVTNSAMASVVKADQPPVPFFVSSIGPHNRNLAMTYIGPPPASRAQASCSWQTLPPRDLVTPYTGPLNVCEIGSNIISPPSPKMPGAFIFSPQGAPAPFVPEPLHACQNASNQTPSPPPKARSNLYSRTISSGDTHSSCISSSVDPVWQNVYQNRSNIGPPLSPEARGIFNSTVIPPRDRLSYSVHSVFPLEICQNGSNKSQLRQLKEPNVVGPAYIPFEAETADPAVSVSSLELQNVYKSQSNTSLSPSPSINTSPIANSAVANLVEVDQCTLLPSVSSMEPQNAPYRRTNIGPSSPTNMGAIANSRAATVVKAPFQAVRRSFPRWS